MILEEGKGQTTHTLGKQILVTAQLVTKTALLAGNACLVHICGGLHKQHLYHT